MISTEPSLTGTEWNRVCLLISHQSEEINPDARETEVSYTLCIKDKQPHSEYERIKEFEICLFGWAW